MVIQMNTKFIGACYVVGTLLITVGIAAYYYEVREWIFATYPWSKFYLIFIGCLLIAVGIIRHAIEYTEEGKKLFPEDAK